ncbi:redox-sensing transcriptional repressor Rex [Heliobacterium gestii]|uniref:Redox-sensing transcriptional repressor Rex n=1 Tax=Heliomicrobium gestii TaxID=2699 RepID=A0A845LAC7_HELGE|nr:redox-sensing transcriptional repressor Rex [Heliomicrobium gestii]MBM7866142.1 redox-sensing transcriptional repressor [Heliomicrobium gestii]MZP42531.1 redox-sensing transcriptional repressor Rex [Heliomicrobium gestii]
MKFFKVPEPTIMRLSLYSRILEQLEERGVPIISSVELGDAVGINSGVVRKDLSMFGEFGVRGVGYNVRELRDNIRKLLGQDRNWPVIIVGAGHLGSSLAAYPGFRQRGFDVVALVDTDPEKIGSTIIDKIVVSWEEAEKLIKEHGVRMAILAVPADSVQAVAQQLTDLGIEAILNFSPIILKGPSKAQVQNVDLTVYFDLMRFTQNLNDNGLRPQASNVRGIAVR